MPTETLTHAEPQEQDVVEAPGGRVYLVVRSSVEVRVVELVPGKPLTLGRSLDADVALDESTLSRKHARFARENGTITVEDCGSRNGLKINGRPAASKLERLRGGDLVGLGAVEVIVALTAPGLARTPSETESDDDRRIVVADPSMAHVFGLARRLSSVMTTVLILGETGVGKEVIAEQIHAWGPRRQGPFVRVNCAALPHTLVESELFGHERGAFTGAAQRRIGHIEAANGGTLLLDEIGELPLELQAKLLLVLENKCLTRLGASVETPIDVRILCATHHDLRAEVQAGEFREDLYYRISTFTLRIPPLRDRPGEVKLLAELFAQDHATAMGLAPPSISNEAVAALCAYAWPGNIRELRNAVEHAMILVSDGVVRLEHLPESLLGPQSSERVVLLESPPVDDKLASMERGLIEQALDLDSGNQTKAAKRLGITRRALIYRMEKYKILR